MLNSEKIPPERKEEMKKEVMEYLQQESITQENLQKISQMEHKTKNPQHKPHEMLVVERLKTHEGKELHRRERLVIVMPKQLLWHHNN